MILLCAVVFVAVLILNALAGAGGGETVTLLTVHSVNTVLKLETPTVCSLTYSSVVSFSFTHCVLLCYETLCVLGGDSPS